MTLAASPNVIGLGQSSEAALEPAAIDRALELRPAVLVQLTRLTSLGLRYCLWRQTVRPEGALAVEALVSDVNSPVLGTLDPPGSDRDGLDWPVPSRAIRPDAKAPPVIFTELIHYGPAGLAIPRDVSRQVLHRARPVRGVYVPSPDDGLMGLLLECILEHGRFDPEHCRRAEALMGWPALIDDFHLAWALDQTFRRPGLWEHVRGCLFAQDFDALLRLRPILEEGLVAPERPA